MKKIFELPVYFILFFLHFPISLGADGIDFSREKISTASLTNIYATPNASDTILSRVNIGSKLSTRKRSLNPTTLRGMTDYWYSLMIDDEHSGWVFGADLLDYNASQHDQIYLNIAKKNINQEKYRFYDMVQLFTFIEKNISNIRQQSIQSELKLIQLFALQKSLNAISETNQNKSPYKEWLSANRNKIIYDPNARHWTVLPKNYWQLADQYNNTPLRDELAWQASNATLVEDCPRRNLSCHILHARQTSGAYLQRSPGGEYINLALRGLNQYLAYFNNQIGQQPNYLKQLPIATRKELQEAVQELDNIITRTSKSAEGRVVALQNLHTIQQTLALVN